MQQQSVVPSSNTSRYGDNVVTFQSRAQIAAKRLPVVVQPPTEPLVSELTQRDRLHAWRD